MLERIIEALVLLGLLAIWSACYERSFEAGPPANAGREPATGSDDRAAKTAPAAANATGKSVGA